MHCEPQLRESVRVNISPPFTGICSSQTGRHSMDNQVWNEPSWMAPTVMVSLGPNSAGRLGSHWTLRPNASTGSTVAMTTLKLQHMMAFTGKYTICYSLKIERLLITCRMTRVCIFYININHVSTLFNRKTVVQGGNVIPHPFGISLFEHNVYFTDWTRLAVMKANKFTDSSPQVVYSTTQTPYGVSVIHQLKQPHGKPPRSEPEWH